jgi:hypothetical protein
LEAKQENAGERTYQQRVQLELSSTMTDANAEEYDLQCISTMRENVYVNAE